MNDKQWDIFCTFKKDLETQVEHWTKAAPQLGELQKKAALAAKNPLYPFETPVVYNRALDEITKDDDIKLIVIGDNPGKDEQLAINNKYLVGQAGKIAEGYFRRNPELAIDFRRNVIILNKTPIHSAKTAQLKIIAKLGGSQIANLIDESQIWMAKKTAQLHIDLCQAGETESAGIELGGDRPLKNPTELWLVGYSELKTKGIFAKYREQLKQTYMENSLATWDKVFVFQHFSMNRFSIDLSDNLQKNKSLLENIHRLGLIHKNEIF